MTDEERQQLEANLKAEKACRDALVVWKETGILLDGHNRHEICTRLGIGYRVVELSFPDREAAADWIDRNQLGRRNLPPEHRSLLRGRMYERAKKREGAPIGNRNAANQLGQNDPVDSGSTASRLAKQHGVSEPTIKRDAQYAAAVEKAKAVDPDIERRIASGTAPAKSAIVQAAKHVEAEPEKARAILQGEKPPASSTPADPAKPWAEFAAKIRGVMSKLRSNAAELRDILEFDSETNTIRTRWRLGYSYQSTVGGLNQFIRHLEDGLPVELSPNPPGYITVGRKRINDQLKITKVA